MLFSRRFASAFLNSFCPHWALAWSQSWYLRFECPSWSFFGHWLYDVDRFRGLKSRLFNSAISPWSWVAMVLRLLIWRGRGFTLLLNALNFFNIGLEEVLVACLTLRCLLWLILVRWLILLFELWNRGFLWSDGRSIFRVTASLWRLRDDRWRVCAHSVGLEPYFDWDPIDILILFLLVSLSWSSFPFSLYWLGCVIFVASIFSLFEEIMPISNIVLFLQLCERGLRSFNMIRGLNDVTLLLLWI